MTSSGAQAPDQSDDQPKEGLVESLRQRAGLIGTIVIFVLALLALQAILKDFHYHQIVAQLKSLSARQLTLALLFTAGSYWSLTGYDVAALRYAGIKLPYRLVAFASFTGYAVSNNLGFMLLSGGSIRFRLYSAAGVSASDIAKVVLFAALTFTVGIFAVASLSFLIAPGELAPLAHLQPGVAAAIGGVSLAATLALLIVAALSRRAISLGRLQIALPSVPLVLSQIAISGIDIAFAGAVLYAVLPPLPGMDYLGFIGLYSVALLVGVLSHVPGGLGVFESVMLLGLGRRADAGAVLGSIIAYRAIYFLLPLILAGILLAINEFLTRRPNRLKQLKLLGGAGTRLVPTIMAALVFVAGVILLISGAAPETEWRLDLLVGIVPLPVLELSHILGSVIGLGLLILARGLYRRLDSAWFVSIIALAAAIILSLIKGLDYEEATILGLVLLTLLPCRPEFYRQARISDLRITFGWLLAIAGVVIGIVWLTFFTTKHVEYSNELWWQFAFFDNAPRSLRTTFLVVIILLFVSLSQLFRPSAARPHPPTDEEIAAVRRILAGAVRPDANLALLRDKALLFNDARTAFIMYGVRGRSWIALGDPVGPAEEAPELIWRFRELCDRFGGRPAFYQVAAEELPHYLDVGLTPVKLGEEARVYLPAFSLDQPGRKDLRYSKRRAERDGLSFAVLSGAELELHMDALQAVSDAWLETRNTPEKRFSVGAFDRRYLREFEVAVVRANDRITAFANIWRAQNGACGSVDVMRFDPNGSAYTMEYLFIELLLWAKSQNLVWFGLGMAPLSGLAMRDLAPLWQRLGWIVFQAGDRFYNFRGLRLFKDKFRPTWEPRYLVCQGGLSPLRVLSDTAALIAGGFRGVITR